MLDSIQVKNVALIDSAEVEFEKGLNILTGETGAGKSILLSSVQLALGAKADKALIRDGAEYASVTLTFSPNDLQIQLLKELDIDCDEDGLILQRRIYPNKSVCKINGETVILKTMQSVAELLIDIHGQREHQSILKKSVQEDLLDNYCAEVLTDDLMQLKQLYFQIKDLEKQLDELYSSDGGNERELDFAKYELDEIVKAELKQGEDVSLEEQFEKLSNAQKIEENVGLVRSVLSDSDHSVLNALSVAMRNMNVAQGFDGELADAYGQLSDAEVILQDLSHYLDQYLDRFSMDGQDLQSVTDRLNLINHLKDKYGNSIETILDYADTLADKIERIENSEHYVKELQDELTKTKCAYYELAYAVHQKRIAKGTELSEQIKNALVDLNFEQCEFSVACEYSEEYMKKNGCTSVTFLISLNKGEALRELTAVASGGELSRVMLAFKSVFADKDQIGTLVFDEIDAGISGKTAWKVSEKLAVIRKEHQVICITHLPQIAAMADAHFCIEKSTIDERTKTSVTKLSEDGSIQEIGRLLGTDQLTDAVIQNAVEMKKLAEQTKQY